MSVAVTSINEIKFVDKAYFPRPSYTYRIANQKYMQTLYLVVYSEDAIGGILNWQISVLYGEIPMLAI